MRAVRLAGDLRTATIADRADALYRIERRGPGSSIYMTLLPMGVCCLAWFAMLRYLPPEVASTGMLLVPIAGVGAAVLSLGSREIAAMALTVSAVTLALWRQRQRKQAGA